MAQMPIPADWNEEDWCCVIVEWPKSQDWQSILAGLLLNPTSGRFWDASTGSVIDVQAIGAEIEARNCIFVQEGSMTCLDDIIAALNNINLSINVSQGCCGGSGGSGQTAGAPSDFVDNGTDFPGGYGNRTEYEGVKCDLALFVINRMLSDLSALKTVNVAGKAAAILATLIPVVLLTPIPLDDILAVIVIAVLGLVAGGISAFTTAIDELIARIDAMDICVLYEASTVQAAIVAVHDWIDGGTYSINPYTAMLGKGLIGVDALNVLFSDAPTETMNLDELPSGDCSTCSDVCPIYIFDVGSEDGEPYHFASQVTGANHSLSVQFNTEALDADGPWCGPMAEFRISFADWTIYGADPIMKIWNDDDAPITLGSATEYNSITALPSPSTVFNGRQFAFNSSTPFTAIVTLV